MKVWRVWREAAKLFWRRPVLSLPVLVAAIVPFVIEGVDSLWKRLLLPPPILAYGVHPPFSQVLTQSAKENWNAYWPLFLADIFIQAAICSIALFVTAGAIRRLTSEEPTALLRYGMMFARSRWRDVIWLSLAGSALLIFYDAAHFIVYYFWVTHLDNQAMKGDPAGHLEVLMWLRDFAVPALYACLFCITAWILTGMAMRGIRPDDLQHITRDRIWRGRRLAIVAMLLSAAIGFTLNFARGIAIPAGGLDGTVAEWELNVLHSLITALPYVLLFIALTRIVDQDDNVMT